MRFGYRYIDYMLLMTYNYHGSGWEMTTGHHSPILPHRRDPPGDQRELYLVSGPLPVCQNLSHKEDTVGTPPTPTHPPTINENSTS